MGNRSEKTTGTVSAPIYLSSAYRHQGIGQSTGYDYTRTGNPTRQIVEEAITQLELGDQGFATSSGMAAIQTIFGLFKQGDEIIVSHDLYGGSYRLFQQILQHYGLVFHYADIRRPDQFEQLINENTKALFIETPTNPLMQEADLTTYGQIVRENDLILIVDNTFYTPILQQPIRHGAHIVIHSATKYLGGHNDVLAGLIVAKGEALCEKLAMLHNGIGAVLSPFDSWLLIRGMKTLSLRMKKHEENAKAIQQHLEQSPYVEDVLYPGRGGMISFRVKRESVINPFLQNLKLITFAESLGGVESFITFPATQTHADIPEEIRIANGVCNRLLRFSVGVEDHNDIIRDLEQALKAASSIQSEEGVGLSNG
ncbi:methionine biosynthesis PLP-dependent protein [Evansella vedderi]